MADPAFMERLRALNLQRMPAADLADLERLVKHAEGAAARVRMAFSYLEEPSNVFRLSPAGEVKA
jgi:hypothetical protein